MELTPLGICGRVPAPDVVHVEHCGLVLDPLDELGEVRLDELEIGFRVLQEVAEVLLLAVELLDLGLRRLMSAMLPGFGFELPRLSASNFSSRSLSVPLTAS